ncbi:MAG: maleylpyruvate isomerase N-terminal domain-containing protein [Chitinophagaceae bacterium]|nr:maleylpyruvate isomerase N-terminal domain-containing protein [Chitinophagaceae bacterium]
MNKTIETLSLFPVLNRNLIDFLRGLSPDDWRRQTVARKWKIKDVAAHLLDGNFRRIALHRDGWASSPDKPIALYTDLVQYLNELNADWVQANRRLSPQLIVDLLEWSNAEVYKLFQALDPMASSAYPVSWAGQSTSYNWFDIAREYTERWLHQQQIRDAAGNTDLMNRELYHPLLDIFMQAWPVALDNEGREGIVLKTVITGDGGGEWLLKKEKGKWQLNTDNSIQPSAETLIDGRVAWKLFSKSVRKDDIRGSYEIKGDQRLGERVLEMVSVMA